MKIFIISILFLASFYVIAGDKVVGNGGDAIVCRNNSGEIIFSEFYDIFEAREERGIMLSLGDEALSIKDKLDIMLDRLSRFSPIRAEVYRKEAYLFLKSYRMVPGLEDIPDSNHSVYLSGPNCIVEQVIKQKEKIFDEDKEYLIAKDIWNNFSNDSKAVAIIHEIMWKEAISYGHKYSNNLRYLGSKLFSKDLEGKSIIDYLFILQKTNFKKSEYKGGVITIDNFLRKYYNTQIDSIIDLNIILNEVFDNKLDFIKWPAKTSLDEYRVGFFTKDKRKKLLFPYSGLNSNLTTPVGEFNEYHIFGETFYYINSHGSIIGREGLKPISKLVNGQELLIAPYHCYNSEAVDFPLVFTEKGNLLFAMIKVPNNMIIKDIDRTDVKIKSPYAIVRWDNHGEIISHKKIFCKENPFTR